jgi:hypothetical protein
VRRHRESGRTAEHGWGWRAQPNKKWSGDHLAAACGHYEPSAAHLLPTGRDRERAGKLCLLAWGGNRPVAGESDALHDLCAQRYDRLQLRDGFGHDQRQSARQHGFHMRQQRLDGRSHLHLRLHHPQEDAQITGFSAAADGTLTPIPGSPHATPAYSTVATGSVLFGIDSGNVDSFRVRAGGCLSLENSPLAAQGTAPNWSQEPQALFLDPNGANLYASEYTPPDGLLPGLFSYNFDPANGQPTQAGAEAIGGDSTLAFASNDQYAVATYCNDRGGGYIAEYQKSNNGALTFLGDGPQPTGAPGQPWCYGNTAADASDHVVVEVTPWEYAGASPCPSRLAIYTLDDSGSLSTSSASQNMITSQFAPAFYQFSPDGRYLAGSGASGLQLFAWNSASLTSIAAIDRGGTCTSGGCSGPAFGNIAWDENDHLYTILGQQLLVYDVSPDGVTPAPGSPYPVQNPVWVTCCRRTHTEQALLVVLTSAFAALAALPAAVAVTTISSRTPFRAAAGCLSPARSKHRVWAAEKCSWPGW